MIRSEKLEVTSFPVFLSSIKSDDGYQIGGRVSPDTRRPIWYHVICFDQRARAKIKRWLVTVENLCTVKQW